MNLLTRRQSLKFAAAGLGSGLALLHGAEEPETFDLVIKGGHVIDPAANLSRKTDVGIRGGKIARIADSLSAGTGQTVDATGCLVTPGLVDMHVHVYDAVAPIGIPADPNCIARGVTTVLDGGSAGAHTFPGFRKYVIQTAETRIFALLNISVAGQATFSPENPHGELLDLRYVNARLAAQTIERNRDRILGLKVRLTRNIAGDHDLEVLSRAVEAGRMVRLPVMVHIGGSKSPLKDILGLMREGDVITHGLREGEGGILNDRGLVLPEVKEALARGIRLDVGHGANGFSFQTAARAMEQGIVPHTISSDLHSYNVRGPVFDLLTTMSKFLILGMTIDQVVSRATINPATTFSFPNHCGRLQVGLAADVSVIRLASRKVTFLDSEAVSRNGSEVLEPVVTLRGGKIYGSAAA